jgi:hypothetical protein
MAPYVLEVSKSGLCFRKLLQKRARVQSEATEVATGGATAATVATSGPSSSAIMLIQSLGLGNIQWEGGAMGMLMGRINGRRGQSGFGAGQLPLLVLEVEKTELQVEAEAVQADLGVGKDGNKELIKTDKADTDGDNGDGGGNDVNSSVDIDDIDISDGAEATTEISLDDERANISLGEPRSRSRSGSDDASSGTLSAKQFEESPFMRRLYYFYTVYNSTKLADLQNLHDKYNDSQQKLFSALTHKYGPEPTQDEVVAAIFAAGANAPAGSPASLLAKAVHVMMGTDGDAEGSGGLEGGESADVFETIYRIPVSELYTFRVNSSH